jgi:hypothetical protein
MPRRANQIADRIAKAVPRDANLEDVTAALEALFAAYLDMLPPKQRQRFARKFERRIPDILERTNQLARARDDYCRRHTTRH